MHPKEESSGVSVSLTVIPMDSKRPITPSCCKTTGIWNTTNIVVSFGTIVACTVKRMLALV